MNGSRSGLYSLNARSAMNTTTEMCVSATPAPGGLGNAVRLAGQEPPPGQLLDEQYEPPVPRTSPGTEGQALQPTDLTGIGDLGHWPGCDDAPAVVRQTV